MKDLWIVASFTIKEMIKRKSFIISNLVIFLIIIVGFNVPNIIDSVKGEDEEVSGDSIILMIDESNIFKGELDILNQMELGKTFKIQNKMLTIEEIKKQIDEDEIFAAMIINKQDNNVNVEYIADSISQDATGPNEVLEALAKLYTNLKVQELGLTNEQLQTINPTFNINLTQTNDNPASGNVFAIMLLSIVLFYAIYFCAYQVSSSITTEKTSKIMETLVTSTSPRTIVLGKTIGIGIVGLLQVISIIVVSVISCNVFMDSEIISNIVDLSKITPGLAIITLLYFILGYALYSLLYALTGSTVSKPEDINSANGPVAILAVIGFYLAYFSMMNPTADLNVFASVLPLSAPFSMPFRVMMGTATPMQVAISIGVMILCIIIIAKISIKIYSSAILNYGTKMSIKDIFKIYKDKNN